MDKEQAALEQATGKYLVDVPVQVTQKEGIPVIEIRRVIHDLEIIKTVAFCALHSRPVVVMPCFSNQLRSINSMIEKGLLYYDREGGQYFFNF